MSDKTISEAGQIFLINCYNITIPNQNLSYASGGIVGFNCTKITLANSTVNHNNEFGVIFRRSSDCDIINNTISFNYHAIQIEDHDKFTITNNIIAMNQAGGIIIRWRAFSPSVVSTIKDNRVINSSRGIEISDVLWVSIINNTIINNSECGIRVQYGYDINVTSNLVEHNGGGVELRYVEGCILTNNTIIGHGFDIHDMDVHQFNQWIVQNNTVNGKPVIFWMDVTDRVVPETTGQVFLIRVQRINVTNLIIDSVANSIYAIDSDDVKIQDCIFSNNSRVALRLQYTSSCDISGNYIIQNDQGIHLQDSNFNIFKNNIITNNQNGIELGNSRGTQILRNFIHNNFWRGISVWGSPFTVIHNNSIINHYSEGLRVYGSDFCNLVSNIIANNNGYGIELWGSSYTQILENLIHNNSWRGISVWDSSNTVIHNNSIMNHDSQGLAVDNSGFCIISNNIMANNNGPGIELSWETEECTIENNLIYNNSNGINLHDSLGHNITNNEIVQNRGVGVNLRGGTNNILLSYNTISENYDKGIWAEDVYNTRIVNNTVSSNCVSDPKLAGIQLQWSSYNTIERNELSSNGIAFNFERATDNEIIYNSVVNNSYGFYLDLECTDNTIRYNDFIANFHLIQKQIFTGSQVFDDGLANIFIFNHYNDWISPDDDLDGYVNSPYLISGSAQNNDPCPLTQPYPPLTRRIYGNKVLYPNGGEIIDGTIYIEWMNTWDSHGYSTTYSVYFSEDNGENWNVIIAFSFRHQNVISWNTLECYDGSSYLVKVVAHASDGFSHEDISDGTFTVRNGIRRPPSPPPLVVRILLFVFLCSFIIVFIKQGRTQAS
ncbi:MAG: right-handed parallel beta-helix repeat-containing protein [Candidatus Hodarchaeota archaeon]